VSASRSLPLRRRPTRRKAAGGSTYWAANRCCRAGTFDQALDQTLDQTRALCLSVSYSAWEMTPASSSAFAWAIWSVADDGFWATSRM